MNFKQAFVNYQNVSDFYCFVKTYKYDLIEDYQQKIELLFDINETFSICENFKIENVSQGTLGQTNWSFFK